jgi:hypothetical protein
MTAVASSPSTRSARLGLRATPEQEVVLRRAAEVAHKSLTDFILDRCQATRRFDPLTTSGIDPRVNQLSDVIGVGAAAFCRRPLRRLSRSR